MRAGGDAGRRARRSAPEALAVARARSRRARRAARARAPPTAGARRSRAAGPFQRANFALAVAAAEALPRRARRRDAVRGAAAASSCPGGWRSSPSEPLVVLDGAHNPTGCAALADALPAMLAGRRLVARRLDPGRQGRGRRCSRALLPLCDERRLHALAQPARAAAGDARDALAAARRAAAPSRRRPARGARARARARRPRRRRAGHRLDLPARRPRARARRAPGRRSLCTSDGPSPAR